MTNNEHSYSYVFLTPCILFRHSEKNTEEIIIPENAPVILDSEKHVKSKKLLFNEQITHPSLFNISYPFITEFDNTDVMSIINQSIVNETIALLKKYVLLSEKTDFKEISSFYKVPLNEKGILSILFGLYTYKDGAHGITNYCSFSLNTKNGYKYKLSDLLNPKLNYIGELNEIILKEIDKKGITLIREFNDMSMDEQFYLTQDSLVLYYQPDDYTPNENDLFEITIPYNNILNLLSTTSPIKKFLQI